VVERKAADAELETVRSQLVGATKEFEAKLAGAKGEIVGVTKEFEAKIVGVTKMFEAKLAGAKGEFEAKLISAGLAAEVASLRVLKDYSVSVAGGEASKDRGGAE
jgi:hypothetical protein